MSQNSTDEARDARLAEFNTTLNALGLKSLTRVGNSNNNEIELLEIIKIIDDSKKFFIDVMFTCRFPGGAEGRFTIRWNANSLTSDGAVFVPIINGKFALVKSYRPALGRWIEEFPRGFGEKIDQARINGQLGTLQIADLPLGTLMRELGEEVLKGATVSSVTHLGNIAQDSGTHTAAPAYYLVNIEVDKAALATRLESMNDEGMMLRLYGSDQLPKLLDSHSRTARDLYREHTESLPRARS